MNMQQLKECINDFENDPFYQLLSDNGDLTPIDTAILRAQNQSIRVYFDTENDLIVMKSRNWFTRSMNRNNLK